MPICTRVTIVGAGPAGLCVANILQQEGIDTIVLERRDRQHIAARDRAGTIDHRSVQLLRWFGLAGNLLRHGKVEDSIEFRLDGARHVLSYASVAPGGTHLIYPQRLLVQDLIEAYLAGGGDLRFGAEVTALDLTARRPAVTVTLDGRRQTIGCDFVAGCDGDRGVCARSVPGGRRHEHREDYAWLAVAAEAPPSASCVVTGLHQDGTALHIRRTDTTSRFYLQCGAGEGPEHWPAERIWRELHGRLAVEGAPALREGPVRSVSLVPMRSVVREPLRAGPLLLAGDAAHIVPPVGAKGMNLALADAEELALALVHQLKHRNGHRLEAYSRSRLQAAWRAQEFVHWMMGLVNTPGLGTPDAGFQHRLQRARLARLLDSKPYAEAFIAEYVGLY